jgi:hypothetical protein
MFAKYRHVFLPPSASPSVHRFPVSAGETLDLYLADLSAMMPNL